jgi:hypothetical protein
MSLLWEFGPTTHVALVFCVQGGNDFKTTSSLPGIVSSTSEWVLGTVPSQSNVAAGEDYNEPRGETINELVE